MAVHLHLLLLHIIILLVWAIKASTINCPTSCGNVREIRYPFGIGKNCSFSEWFEVTCDSSSGSPVPFLKKRNLKLSEDISRRSNGMAIGWSAYVDILESYDLSGTPFSYSHKFNKFIARSCDTYTTTLESATRCLPICTCDPAKNHNCYDFMCTISSSHQSFSDVSVPGNCKSAVMVEQDWIKTNYLANTNPNVLNESEHVPVVMEIGRYMGSCAEPYHKSPKTSCNTDNFCLTQLNPGYFCVCSQPKGNPDESGCTGNLFCNITRHNDCSKCPDGYAPNSSHIVDGKPMCYPAKNKNPGKNKDIPIGLSVALGTLSLSIGAQRLCEFVKRRIANMLKHKFLKKNGGLSLRMASNEGKIKKIKVFTENEVKKATDSFNKNRILGQSTGGQGTVYKGMLDKGIIAVKRPKKVDESKDDVFIRGVVILSQIKHRNVVQLLGCCLETKVPLLVYEFIPNGTLFQHINGEHEQNEEHGQNEEREQNEEHGQNEEREQNEEPLTWDLRLRIVIEVADVLSYLHSADPAPIYHGDIKSSNILLDEKYRAKVSDIGTSRFILVDQTRLTENTPECSSQFTEKSDVYKFGVVLAELLIGQKFNRSTDSAEENGLASYFLQKMDKNCPFEIFDGRVFKDDIEPEIKTFADLTRRCLETPDSDESNRLTMEEVAKELEGIRTSNGASISKQNRLEFTALEISPQVQAGSWLLDCCSGSSNDEPVSDS